MNAKAFPEFMPLMNTPFQPGHCLELINGMGNGPKKDIAFAEYYYFSGQPEKAIQEAEPYITCSDASYRFSACLIYAYANLSVGQTVHAEYAFKELKNALADDAGNQYIFTGTDIEGGRGGELSPGEGENLLPEFTAEGEDTDKTAKPGSQDVSSESETFIAPEDVTAYKASLKIGSASFSDGAAADAQPEEQTAQDAADTGEDASVKTKAEHPENTGAIEKLTGVAIVICILLCTVGFFVYNRKK